MRACRLCLKRRGYPAYAGIDPIDYHVKHFPWGLPRIRGDRPGEDKQDAARDMATPHTRGSTLLQEAKDEAAKGYPAYAGIDLLP